MVFSATIEHPAALAALINVLGNEEEVSKLMCSERGIPASAAGLQICEENILRYPLVAEANGKVMDYVSFPLDPKFEAAALKNTDGVYYDVQAGLSYGDYDVETAADVLIEGVEEVLNK